MDQFNAYITQLAQEDRNQEDAVMKHSPDKKRQRTTEHADVNLRRASVSEPALQEASASNTDSTADLCGPVFLIDPIFVANKKHESVQVFLLDPESKRDGLGMALHAFLHKIKHEQNKSDNFTVNICRSLNYTTMRVTYKEENPYAFFEDLQIAMEQEIMAAEPHTQPGPSEVSWRDDDGTTNIEEGLSEMGHEFSLCLEEEVGLTPHPSLKRKTCTQTKLTLDQLNHTMQTQMSKDLVDCVVHKIQNLPLKLQQKMNTIALVKVPGLKTL